MKPERLFGFRIGRVPAGTGYCRPWSHCHTRACPSGGGFASVATEATPVETCHRHVSKSRLSNPPPAFRQSKKDIPFGMSFRFGGRWWIRTTEVIDDRFTVCSLWPLGNPSTLSCKRCWLARFSVWRGLVRLCFRCPAAPFGFRFREAFVSSKDVFTENRPLWQALFCIFSNFFCLKIKK